MQICQERVISSKDPPHKLAADWFQRFEAVIRGALHRRARNPADIEDLAQEVYLRLLRIPSPDLVENPQAYLYRLSLNVAEEWRQRAPQRFDHTAAIDVLRSEENLIQDRAAEEQKAAIEKALSSLPHAHRLAVLLHVRDGLTYAETAEHMGVTQRSVKRYVAKGYATLRQELTFFDLVEAPGSLTQNESTKDD